MRRFLDAQQPSARQQKAPQEWGGQHVEPTVHVDGAQFTALHAQLEGPLVVLPPALEAMRQLDPSSRGRLTRNVKHTGGGVTGVVSWFGCEAFSLCFWDTT